MAANNTPDFRTISDFPKDHLKALAGLFLQVLKLCQKAGLVKLGHVALDGTKIRANASKQKAMSYKRMKEEEARLDNEVAKLMAKAEAVDEEEDCRYGKDKRGDELPGELAFRESRLKKIREAKAALEARQTVTLNRPARSTRDIAAYQMTKRSETSPIQSHVSCRLPAVSISYRLILPKPLSIVLTISSWQRRLSTSVLRK